MDRNATLGFVLLALVGTYADGQDKQVPVQSGERILQCHEPGIRLEGTLARRWFHGPPGFGETPKRDAREEIFVLELTHAITVVAPPNSTKDETCEDKLTRVSRVQVWAFQEHQNAIREKIGKSVAITGTLDEDPAPGAHIQVQITPRSIEVK